MQELPCTSRRLDQDLYFKLCRDFLERSGVIHSDMTGLWASTSRGREHKLTIILTPPTGYGSLTAPTCSIRELERSSNRLSISHTDYRQLAKLLSQLRVKLWSTNVSTIDISFDLE